MPNYFEDLSVGRSFDLGTRLVTAADIHAFAELSGDRNPLHLDAAYARRTAFGGPVAHGALGIAVATGLLHEAGITHDTLVALVALEWKFLAPVRPGDSLSMRVEVADRRPTSQLDRGIVRFRVVMTNQAGEVVQEGLLTELIRTRPR